MNSTTNNQKDTENIHFTIEYESDESIIENNDCIPDENVINQGVENEKLKAKKEEKKFEEEDKPEKLIIELIKADSTTPLGPLDLGQIARNNQAINSLLNNHLTTPTTNLAQSIVTLIHEMPEYSNYSLKSIQDSIDEYVSQNTPKAEPCQLTTKNELSLIPEEPDNKEKKVFDRLYEKRKKYEMEIISKNKTISNNIPHETQEHLDKLYNDSKKQKKITPQIKKIDIKSNEKSNLILYKKYFSQFNQCISKLYNNGDMKFSNSITLNYLKILMSNDNLGFLSNATGKSNYELLAREEILTQNLFNLLQENGYVSLQNFFIFSLSILNLSNCSSEAKGGISFPALSATSSTSTSSGNLIGVQNVNNNSRQQTEIKHLLNPSVYFSVNTTNNLIVISKAQSNKIFKDFQQFNKNWKNFLVEKTKKRISQQDNLTFKPATNIKYNNKIKGNLFTHIKQSKSRQKSFDRLFYKQKEKKENEELLNCSFKPKLVSHNSRSKYKNINHSYSVSKYNKSRDEIEYESNANEYTFKPNISISQMNYEKFYNESTHSYASNEELQYKERIKKGREEKERIKKATMLRESYDNKKVKYPYPKVLNTSGSYYNKKPEIRHLLGENPLLIIDIEINKSNKRIIIYKDDKPEEISEKFINENNIKDYNLIIQIKKMIMTEMNNIKNKNV